MARARPMTADERAAEIKAARLMKAREWLRYHQNEARIIGTYLRSEPDYFAKEVTRLNRGITQLQDELKNTLERMATCSPEKLVEHEKAAKKFARDVALIENEDKLAALMALAKKINETLPVDVKVKVDGAE